MFIHQLENWRKFIWSNEKVLPLLSDVRHRQGLLMGRMQSLGFKLKDEALLSTLTMDILKTSEIEGEILNKEQVRSSLARRLGIEVSGLVISSRNVDGVVDMMLDATRNYNLPLTEERLFGWHAALFPLGYSGAYKIEVAKYRTGPMHVVSGAMGREKVHYEAPNAESLAEEMGYFLDWFNGSQDVDSVLKAAVAHFWFVAIHPFDDGNGRIARAITDMQLARSDKSPDRFYSMSNQILNERKQYYDILERSQKGGRDITEWMVWFLSCLDRSIAGSDNLLNSVLNKAEFWEKHRQIPLSERQILMLNKLLDGFEGKLTSTKWAKIAKTSRDTALRDIQDLIDKGILQKEPQGGRSTNYELITP